ncbi:MAG: sodium ion-translocating decarboxylase subunit beta, partial [Eggerthellaceae bacterium]|nr:sodium ion-translocating decarboxylase subunit beta [Eggerthellaceae bacterium]
DPRQVIMILIALLLLYLGLVKTFEPLLLVGIAFGMLPRQEGRPGEHRAFHRHHGLHGCIHHGRAAPARVLHDGDRA